VALELLRSLDGEPEADATATWDVEIVRRRAMLKHRSWRPSEGR
jgi:hypothetical protein